MTFSADHHFAIGNMHVSQGKCCQDYAVSGVTNGDDGWSAYAIISDGCSGGNRTEVGAMLVAIAAENAIKRYRLEDMQELRNTTLEQCQIALGLSRYDLLATSISAVFSPAGGRILVEGDGVYAVKLRTKEMWLHKFEWSDNRPYYPIYFYDPKAFVYGHGGDPAANRLTEEVWQVLTGPQSDVRYIPHNIRQLSIEDGMDGVTAFFTAQSLENVECVAIFSDGVCQIEGVDWKDAVIELMAFKGDGEFVKRRVNAFVKNAPKLGRKPQDDLSCAIIKVYHGA